MTTAAHQEPERFHPRVEADFTVKAMANGRLMQARSKNLSMAGVFVLAPLGRLGDKVTLSLPLPQDREVLTAGRVTRVTREGVAVEFDPLDWDDLCTLARYLHPRLP